FLSTIRDSLIRVARAKTVVCCLPTLPFPPLFPLPRAQSGAHELQLRSILASVAADLSIEQGVRIAATQSLDQRSAQAQRRDGRAEITTGFPYTVEHASAVAELLADLLVRPAPKKGLITDLDDTLWAGTVGEVGAENVTWSLDDDSQAHALYQQLLASLAG